MPLPARRGHPRQSCKAPAPPLAHTLECTLTCIHTQVGVVPPCPGQLGGPSPLATSDSHPHPPGGLLGHTLPPFSPLASNTSLVFPPRHLPFPRAGLPSQPGNMAPRGGHAEASFLSGAQGSLSLVTRLLSKPALNGCLFMAQSLARCILGSPAPACVCWEAGGPGVPTTGAGEPEGPVTLGFWSQASSHLLLAAPSPVPNTLSTDCSHSHFTKGTAEVPRKLSLLVNSGVGPQSWGRGLVTECTSWDGMG